VYFGETCWSMSQVDTNHPRGGPQCSLTVHEEMVNNATAIVLPDRFGCADSPSVLPFSRCIGADRVVRCLTKHHLIHQK